MDFTQFIMPELIILVPVLVFIGYCIKKSKLKDEKIPFILVACGVFLSCMWIFSTREVTSVKDVFQGLFSGLVQGIIIAAASVGSNQFVKQIQKANNSVDATTNEESE